MTLFVHNSDQTVTRVGGVGACVMRSDCMDVYGIQWRLSFRRRLFEHDW